MSSLRKLSDLPSGKRPIGASENDPIVGETEWGAPVYRMSSGVRYHVDTDEDQRSVRDKIKDTAKAVGQGVVDYISNPEPNKPFKMLKDFTVEGLKDFQSTVQKTMTGEATPLEAFSLVSAGAATNAPKGALRSGVISFEEFKKQKGLEKFHRELMDRVKSTASEMTYIRDGAKALGVYDGIEVGDILKGKTGPLTVESLGVKVVARSKEQLEKYLKRDKEFAEKFGFGEPVIIEGADGYYYRPTVHYSGDNSSGMLVLDRLKNMATGELRHKKFTGLKEVK